MLNDNTQEQLIIFGTLSSEILNSHASGVATEN